MSTLVSAEVLSVILTDATYNGRLVESAVLRSTSASRVPLEIQTRQAAAVTLELKIYTQLISESVYMAKRVEWWNEDWIESGTGSAGEGGGN
jgi:hypothetical protein